MWSHPQSLLHSEYDLGLSDHFGGRYRTPMMLGVLLAIIDQLILNHYPQPPLDLDQSNQLYLSTKPPQTEPASRPRHARTGTGNVIREPSNQWPRHRGLDTLLVDTVEKVPLFEWEPTHLWCWARSWVNSTECTNITASIPSAAYGQERGVQLIAFTTLGTDATIASRNPTETFPCPSLSRK